MKSSTPTHRTPTSNTSTSNTTSPTSKISSPTSTATCLTTPSPTALQTALSHLAHLHHSLTTPHLLSLLSTTRDPFYHNIHDCILASTSYCKADILDLANYLRLSSSPNASSKAHTLRRMVSGGVVYKGLLRFEVSTQKRNAHALQTSPPYVERVKWCASMTKEFVAQLEAHSDGSIAHTIALRHRVHTLHDTLASHLVSTQQLLAFPPRDAEAARIRCIMLVHDSDTLDSECSMLGAEAEGVVRGAATGQHGEGENGRQRQGPEGEGVAEVEEVECSGLLEKLRAHDGRRKLAQEMRDLEKVRSEVEEWVGRVLERQFAANGAERRGEALAVGVV